MNNKLRVVAILGLLTQLPVALAQESFASQTQVTIGARVWHSSWLSYLPSVYTGVTPAGAPGAVVSIDAVEGSSETDVLPAIAIRYKDYLLSGSYARYAGDFEALHSSVMSPGGQNILTSRTDHIVRKESDMAVGYYITPNIALSLGYKYATEVRDTWLGISGTSTRSLSNTVRGILVGAGANFPIHGGLRFYGNFGYGPAKVKTEVVGAGMGRIDGNGRYLISEIGLNYALPFSTALMKGVSAGLGYRSQSFRTRGESPVYRDRRDFRDVKDGVVLSLNISI